MLLCKKTRHHITSQSRHTAAKLIFDFKCLKKCLASELVKYKLEVKCRFRIQWRSVFFEIHCKIEQGSHAKTAILLTKLKEGA